MPVGRKVVGRVRKLKILKGLSLESREIINRMIAKQHPDAERMLAINNKRNAMTALSRLRKGQLTGTPETPESFAKKIKQGDKTATLYRELFESYLRLLGYGKILERKGLQRTLQQYYAEHDFAARKKVI